MSRYVARHCAMRRAVNVVLANVVLALLLVVAIPTGMAATEPTEIRVASKNFTESYLLAEMVSQVLEEAGYSVERRFGLGGTLICFEALVNDEIDVWTFPVC